MPRIPDDATRRAVCRGFNLVTAEYFDKLGDRLTPAAVIPMFTPEEAIEELEFCVKQLGAKVAMFGNAARRMAKAKDVDPDLARHTVTYERFGIDSDHDYDPVWQKCRELGVAPTFHAGGRGFGLRNSPSNFTYNHIGHFAAAGHAIAKGLFLGGVTRRFPDVNFAFLEGGVGWGCQLFADLIEHWERRGAKGIAYMDPKKLDREAAAQPGRQVRLRRHRRRARQARRLAGARRGRADRRRAGARRLRRLQDQRARRTGSISTPGPTTSAARPTTA